MSYCSLLIRDRLKQIIKADKALVHEVQVKEYEKQILRKLMADDLMHCNSEELSDRINRELDKVLPMLEEKACCKIN